MGVVAVVVVVKFNYLCFHAVYLFFYSFYVDKSIICEHNL